MADKPRKYISLPGSKFQYKTSHIYADFRECMVPHIVINFNQDTGQSQHTKLVCEHKVNYMARLRKSIALPSCWQITSSQGYRKSHVATSDLP
jgi:hypothetical protein